MERILQRWTSRNTKVDVHDMKTSLGCLCAELRDPEIDIFLSSPRYVARAGVSAGFVFATEDAGDFREVEFEVGE